MPGQMIGNITLVLIKTYFKVEQQKSIVGTRNGDFSSRVESWEDIIIHPNDYKDTSIKPGSDVIMVRNNTIMVFLKGLFFKQSTDRKFTNVKSKHLQINATINIEVIDKRYYTPENDCSTLVVSSISVHKEEASESNIDWWGDDFNCTDFMLEEYTEFEEFGAPTLSQQKIISKNKVKGDNEEEGKEESDDSQIY